MTTLSEFLKSNVRNIHIEDGNITAYVRKSVRTFANTSSLKTFDLASVEIPYTKRGAGEFTRFLEKLQRLKGFDALLVECIQNERLLKFLLGKGFQSVPYTDLVSPSVYWYYPQVQSRSLELQQVGTVLRTEAGVTPLMATTVPEGTILYAYLQADSENTTLKMPYGDVPVLS